jgi:hypothetical protein
VEVYLHSPTTHSWRGAQLKAAQGLYQYTRFRLPSSSGSLFIAFKTKAVYKFRVAAILLFYTMKNTLKVGLLIEGLLVHNISGPYIKWYQWR